MLIYNVTTSVNTDIRESWLQWMQDEHIPEILGTGCFEKHVLVRLVDVDESEAITYALQLYVLSKAIYNQYQERYGNMLQKKTQDRWGENVFSFRTLMEVINS